MKLSNKNIRKWEQHYLSCMSGRTYEPAINRSFPVLPGADMYKARSENVREETIDLSELDDDIRVFFVSDHHFGHRNIIKYANRPFSIDDVEESMDEEMIRRHNSVVSYNDIVFFLGDIAFCNTDRANSIIERLNGYKILIIGNHDWNKNKTLKGYVVDETHVSYTLQSSGYDGDILLTHAPFYSHLMLTPGLLNLHGHIHTKTVGFANFVNLCVEHIGYTPVMLEDVLRMHRTGSQLNRKL